MKYLRQTLGGRLPSPAMVVSIVALCVALGGSAYAALGANSVGSGQVINDSLKSKDLKNGKAVKSTDVVDDSLKGVDIAESTLGRVPTANTANSAFSTFHDAGITMPDSLAGTGNPIATLSIPHAGSYVINAKLEAFNASATSSTSDQCTLTAGGDVDTMNFDVDGAIVDDQEVVPMQVVHSFSSPGSVTLACSDFGAGNVLAFFTKITAVEVADLKNAAF